jgi:hypothetical protein
MNCTQPQGIDSSAWVVCKLHRCCDKEVSDLVLWVSCAWCMIQIVNAALQKKNMSYTLVFVPGGLGLISGVRVCKGV